VDGGTNPPAIHKITGVRRSERVMNAITKVVVRAREYNRGQTMAEYALILAAVAVVVFVGYETMGTTITTLLGSVDTSL
jgi:Flp pilus assembly pilin Flp